MDNFDHSTHAPEQSVLPLSATAHPLYHTVESLIHKGNWSAAKAVLIELLALYPDDSYLQELMAAAKARSALLGPEADDDTYQPRSASASRRFRPLIITVAALLILACAIGSVTLALQWWSLPQLSSQRLEMQISQLRQEAEAAIASGDYDRAVLAYTELIKLTPDDRQVREELDQVNELRAVVSLYSEAIAEMEANRWEKALAILQQIEAQQPGYRDVAERINFVQQQQALLQDFNEAETAFKQSRYAEAIQAYETLRSVDTSYQSKIVQEHLFLSYLQLGLTEEKTAGANTALLKAALEKLEKALALYPDDARVKGETRLLRLYLSGLDELGNEDWSQAISDLSQVYEARPDFASGAVVQRLYEAYVGWGDALMADGEAEEAIARYEKASALRGVETSNLGPRMALAEAALATPTPEPTTTPVPPPAPAVAAAPVGYGAAAPVAPTATPVPQPYTLKAMAVRSNCGGGYIHGVIWNAYNLPMAGVIVQAINMTTGAGPLVSNPTNSDGIYQIILGPDQIEGLWMVQIIENGQPVSLGWGQRLGGGCVNGAQELKADWQREIMLD